MTERDCNAVCNERPEIVNAGEPSADLGTSRRDAGKFTTGNLDALKHGLRSKQVRAGKLEALSDEDRAALRERVTAIVRDLGGDDTVGVLARDAVERYVALQLVEDWLRRNIIANGPLTPKGKQRAALSALLQVSDRTTKLALALGLQRQAARTITPTEWMNHAD